MQRWRGGTADRALCWSYRWGPTVADEPPFISADIVLPRHPHTLVCPVCGLTRHLPDGWQAMLGSETLTCTTDQVEMVEVEMVEVESG